MFENYIEKMVINARPWMTLKFPNSVLGHEVDGSEYKRGEDRLVRLKELVEASGASVSTWAIGLLRHTSLSTVSSYVELFSFSPGELGFNEEQNFDAVMERAESFGYGHCPALTGPVLRAALRDEAINQYMIGMKPVVPGKGADPVIYHVEARREERWLNVHDVGPRTMFSIEHKFVFTRSARKS